MRWLWAFLLLAITPVGAVAQTLFLQLPPYSSSFNLPEDRVTHLPPIEERPQTTYLLSWQGEGFRARGYPGAQNYCREVGRRWQYGGPFQVFVGIMAERPAELARPYRIDAQ